MKVLFWTVAGFAVIGLILFTCSGDAPSHSNERTAIYNLSGMMYGLARQLDRIEDRLGDCFIHQRKEKL